MKYCMVLLFLLFFVCYAQAEDIFTNLNYSPEGITSPPKITQTWKCPRCGTIQQKMLPIPSSTSGYYVKWECPQCGTIQQKTLAISGRPSGYYGSGSDSEKASKREVEDLKQEVEYLQVRNR